MLELEWGMVGVKQLLEAMIKQMERDEKLNLESLRGSLPDDLQQLLFELHTPENFVGQEDSLRAGEEWQRTYRELSTEITKSQIAKISAELSKLDEKREKTPEEEEKQNKLLKQIVQLRSKV